MMQECEDSHLPSFIDVTPSVIQYDNTRNRKLLVNLTNLTTNTVTISPKAVICELQPVSIEESVFINQESEQLEKIWKEVQIEPTLTVEQNQRLKELLTKHKDVFSQDDTDLGHCDRIKHRIDLLNEVPFKQKHRRIPPHMIDEVRQHLEQLLASDVIQKSKSPWCSNVVLVRKKERETSNVRGLPAIESEIR